MFLWLAVRWWYNAGWMWAVHRAVIDRLERCAQTFSIGPLIKTWFSPFKQTYSGATKGSLDLKFHALLDNLISRVMGFFARTFIILTGVISCIFIAITGLLFILIWPIIPLLPVLGILLFVSGVGV